MFYIIINIEKMSKEKPKSHGESDNREVVSMMSNGLCRRGIRLGFKVDEKDMASASHFLFNLTGDLVLNPPDMQEFILNKSYETKFDLEQGISRVLMLNFCLNVGIEIMGVDSEGISPSYNISSYDSLLTKSSEGEMHELSIHILPLGDFFLKIDQMELTNKAKDRVQKLKTSSEALHFMYDFGSHFSVGHHTYGGTRIHYTFKEPKAGMRIGDSKSKSKISGKVGTTVAKAEAAIKNDGSCSLLESKTLKSKSEIIWEDFSEKDKKEYIKKLRKNPEKAKIISRGRADDLVGIWEYLKKDFPVQSKIIRMTWIKEIKCKSDFMRSMKIRLYDKMEEENRKESEAIWNMEL
ncbi:hypothetical protein QYM36_018201 [Artemia franciscana]|uniref:MACPF domain-containing protein n=1 Tax=Artemia franciscana TaxID=6661 RepID=A0AA88HA09_ARTSF|nr:hypothetical protein QYM36_018201 [Artemia franciscana]